MIFMFGYQHFTANHEKYFFNPDTDKQPQLVECLWDEQTHNSKSHQWKERENT